MIESKNGIFLDEVSWRGDKTSQEIIAVGGEFEVIRDADLDDQQLVLFQPNGNFKMKMNDDIFGLNFLANSTKYIIFNPTIQKVVIKNTGATEINMVIWRAGGNKNVG